MQAPQRQQRRITAEIEGQLQPEQIRALALLSDKLQQLRPRVRTCQPAPARQSEPVTAAVVADTSEAAGLSRGASETGGDEAAAMHPGGGDGPSSRGGGSGHAAAAAARTKYPQRTDQQKRHRSAEEYVEHTWDRLATQHDKHVARGKGELATLGLAADAEHGVKSYTTHAMPIRILFDLRSITVRELYEMYERAGQLDTTTVMDVIEHIMVTAIQNDTRPVQGEGKRHGQRLGMREPRIVGVK